MLLRVALGVSMVYHGWDRIAPHGGLSRVHPLAGFQAFNRFVATLGLPFWLGYVSTLTEFLGGLCLIPGLLTRFWSFMIAGNMLVAIWKVNIHGGYGGAQFSIALLTAALLLVTTGSGALSLDRRSGIS